MFSKRRSLGTVTGMSETAEKGERIAKRLARAGLCSRRDAEKLILEGRVSVDGKKLSSPAFNVTIESKITVDGKPLQAAEAPRLWRYHKPAGLITTARDPQGRPTVFERLPLEMPRVISVGRLDFNTEGLLLLTNDGDLARHLELPANAWLRHYRVRVYGRPDPAKLKALEKGITISGIRYDSIKAVIEGGKAESSNSWLSVAIREGKNREIRKLMEHLGLQVTRLIRVSFGPFPLGKLTTGAVEEVPRKVLRGALGKFFETLKD
jgi:23S rRNA pseudouridine2605 synthase